MQDKKNALLEPLYKASTLIDIISNLNHVDKSRNCITIASSTEETNFTYESLINDSKSFATDIIAQTQLGDRVLIAMPTVPDFIYAFFACLMAGRIAVPLPVEKNTSRFSRVKNVIKDCDPALIILSNLNDYEKMKSSIEGLPFLIADQRVSKVFDSKLPIIGEDQIAFIQYTSGSTGNPKGVVITHLNLVENIRMIQQGMQITDAENVVSWLPLHHDMGLIGMLLSFVCCGAKTYIYPYQEFARDPASWLRAIESRKATLTGAPNFAFNLIAKLGGKESCKNDLSSLRMIYCGSERISESSIKAFYEALQSTGLKPETFFPCYGLAEASLYVSGKFVLPKELKQESSFPNCGKIAHGLSVRIKSDDGSNLPPYQIGEVFVSGNSISPGYWNDIRSTVKNGIYIRSTTKELCTGDLGFVGNGDLFITGRKNDVIKVRGRNVYPEDVELAVEAIEGWFPSNGVIAIPNYQDGQEDGILIIAEINRERRRDISTEILAKIQVVLSNQEIRCNRLVILQPLSLPKTSSGKKQRSKTAELVKTGKLAIIWDSEKNHETCINESGPISPLISVSKAFRDLESYVFNTNMLLADERRTLPADFLNQIRRLGLGCFLIKSEDGGRGLSHEEFAKVGKKLGYTDLTVGVLLGNHNTIGVLPIVYSKILSDRAAILRDIAQNGSVTSFAITEPEAGSNPRAIRSSIVPSKNGFSLTGEKVWIGNATFAEYITVFAKEYDNQGKALGISAFLLRKSVHFFEIGEEQLTLGLRAMPQARLIFRGTELKESDRLTPAGQGLALAFPVMEYARFGLACLAIGAMKKALELVLSYAENRSVWTGKLINNGYFLSKIQEHRLRVSAMEKIVGLAAQTMDRGNSLPTTLSSICKILAGEWLWIIVDDCLQFCGGRGYSETFGLAKIFRDSRVLRIFEGPTESIAFQLGALVFRNDHHTDIDDLYFKNAIRDLQTEIRNVSFNQKVAESFNVLTGLFAAEFLAYKFLLSDESPHSQNYNNIQTMLVLIKNNWVTKIHHMIVPDFTKEKFDAKKMNSVRPLYDTWTGSFSEASEIEDSHKALTGDSASGGKSRIVNQSLELEANSTKISYDVSSTLEVELKLAQWISAQTKINKIENTRSLAEYGVDSLMAYELICFVEETFGVQLSEDVVTLRPSLEYLATIILNKNKIT